MGIQDLEMLLGADAAAVESAVAGVAAVGAIVAVIVAIAVLALLISPIVMGIFCKKLARHKGYTGYFWTGFFFGVIGLLYVVGLPDLNIRKDMRAVMKRLVSANDRLTTLEDQQFTRNY